MRKIKTKENLNIHGYGLIPAGTEFMVQRYNKIWVYCKIGTRGTTLKLARKRDCEIVY